MNEMRIQALYKRMFEADEDGDTKMAGIVKKYLDSVVLGKNMSRKEFLEAFMEFIRPKKVYDSLNLLLGGELVNEIDVSVEVCSLLTHSFLAVEKISLAAYEYLEIDGQIGLLKDFLHGEVSADGVKEFYRRVLS